MKRRLYRAAARAIAKSHGHDPEDMIVPSVSINIAGKTVAAISGATYQEAAMPIWQMFIAEGNAAVDAVLEELSQDI